MVRAGGCEVVMASHSWGLMRLALVRGVRWFGCLLLISPDWFLHPLAVLGRLQTVLRGTVATSWKLAARTLLVVSMLIVIS
jgi:hypothetical protein